jgi:hypothetical protein
MKTIEAQIAAMAAEWPALALVESDGRRAVWQGRLGPFETEYLINIRYEAPLAPEVFTIGRVLPRIKVLEPALEEHPNYELGPIPHVFWRGSAKDEPELCVFDPATDEWSPCDLLARTTVYWTLDWLLFYEGWLATKRWRGSGRQHDPNAGRRAEKAREAIRRFDTWLTSTARLAG